MTKRNSNGNVKSTVSEGRRLEDEEPGLEDFIEPTSDEAMAGDEGSEAPGNANESAEEILRLLEVIKADVIANKDKVAGLVMVCAWNDGTMTHGWTGNFDPEITAGKLFNLATDFSVYSAIRKSALTPRGTIN